MQPDKKPRQEQSVPEETRTGQIGVSPAALAFEKSVRYHLLYTCVRHPDEATEEDYYLALSTAVRDRLVQRWLDTQKAYRESRVKRVCYLSSEFLTGRSLGLCLMNLGLYDVAERLLERRGLDLGEVLEREGDAGLGNGGLGRLAACFMDSLATLALPATGYGIRYDYGIFRQRIEDGCQREYPDDWLRRGNPWEVARHDLAQTVHMYGRVETTVDEHGRQVDRWVDTATVIGLPFDSLIVGHERYNVNTLRLWAARASQEFDLGSFNAGDYYRAVGEKVEVENISKVLYPADHTYEGKELRLKQQYFFVACSLADALTDFKKRHVDIHQLPDYVAIQLNDTHPAVAVAELMRILTDQEGLPFEEAWTITQRTCGYTNHTLLPEALEKWPVPLFERVLPRHLKIIYEINHRFLAELDRTFPGDNERKLRMSLIEEGEPKFVRMAHLATLGSHSINGVAALHSELVKRELLRDFYDLYPTRFTNQTNGITPRRWLLYANPRLSKLIGQRLRPELAAINIHELDGLRAFVDDDSFLDDILAIKRANKLHLLRHVQQEEDCPIDPDSMFIVQAKRIHEYKRQLLAVLEVISRYLDLRDDPSRDEVPRTYFFAGKAAPGYLIAKEHIRLINDVASVVNRDARTRHKLQIHFLPNYSVTMAQRLMPAADISLQISLAGKEASGTGNMKFALGGAITVGTLDGANVEIRDAVYPENFLLFGMAVEEVSALRAGGYSPQIAINRSTSLQRVLTALESGTFSPGEPGRYRGVAEYLRHYDPYMTCEDFEDYLRAQREASALFRDRRRYAQCAVHNIAGGGKFSSDATISGYASEIWGLRPLPVHGES